MLPETLTISLSAKEAVSMETSQKQVVFTGGNPILNVKNVAVSLDYYCTTLGFEQVFCWPRGQALPTFAQVSRGDFSVSLAQEAQGGPRMWMYLDLASVEDWLAIHRSFVNDYHVQRRLRARKAGGWLPQSRPGPRLAQGHGVS